MFTKSSDKVAVGVEGVKAWRACMLYSPDSGGGTVLT